MDKVINLTDHFLIAMPGMGDASFDQAVTLVYQHNRDGAVGITVNKTAGFTLGEVFKQMNITCKQEKTVEQPVLQGGPVQTERGFVLHSGKPVYDSSMAIDGRWSVTTSRDILEAMAAGEGPDHSVVALGYAGWEADQLEKEIGANAWLTVPADDRIVFNTNIEERWHSAVGLVGADATQLTRYAGHA